MTGATSAQQEQIARAVAEAVKSGAKIEIHHIVPLEWAHIMGEGFDPNSIDNLAGLSQDIHHQISGYWTKFRNKYKNSVPSMKDIQDYADYLGEIFGHEYIK